MILTFRERWKTFFSHKIRVLTHCFFIDNSHTISQKVAKRVSGWLLLLARLLSRPKILKGKIKYVIVFFIWEKMNYWKLLTNICTDIQMTSLKFFASNCRCYKRSKSNQIVSYYSNDEKDKKRKTHLKKSTNLTVLKKMWIVIKKNKSYQVWGFESPPPKNFSILRDQSSLNKSTE